MVAPLVIYGACALGGVVVGALSTWGVSKLCQDDADRIRKMEIEYENQKAQAEIEKKKADCKTKQLEAEIKVIKLELEKAKLIEEVKKAALRAAQAEEDALKVQERVKKMKT
jgi:hypothetical protein